ncbi:MAG: PKD domain-containing protein, partial [Candidatus Thermoplasmatota archaeon]|nr:PKD domain-containing protein [Candidatus Thermoplasmatota archaeon]
TDPDPPEGPLTGINNTNYEFQSSTNDPDTDHLFYLFDWGDGIFSDWLGPYSSGELASANHNWTYPGIYDIQVKAKDAFGLETDWSIPVTIEISGSSEAPNLPIDPYPFDQAFDVPLPITLSCMVSDPDDDSLDTTFIWGSGEYIIDWNYSYNISSGMRAEFQLDSLEINTTYWWYVEVSDGFYTTISQKWIFTTGVDTTPPLLDIIRPVQGFFYCEYIDLEFNYSELIDGLIDIPIILGKFNVNIIAFDIASNIEKVEYYVDNIPMVTTQEYPYSFYWEKRMLMPSVLTIKAYDKSGNMIEKDLQVWKIL